MTDEKLPEHLNHLFEEYLTRLDNAWEAKDQSMLNDWFMELGFKCGTTQDAIILLAAVSHDVGCRGLLESAKEYKGEPFIEGYEEFLGKPWGKAIHAYSGFDDFREQIELPQTVYVLTESDSEDGLDFIKYFATEEAIDAAIELHKSHNLETGRRITWDDEDCGEYDYWTEKHYMNSTLYTYRKMVQRERDEAAGKTSEERQREIWERHKNPLDFSSLDGKVKPKLPTAVYIVDSVSEWRNDVVGYFSSRENAEEALALQIEFDTLRENDPEDYWIEEHLLYYDGQYELSGG